MLFIVGDLLLVWIAVGLVLWFACCLLYVV